MIIRLNLYRGISSVVRKCVDKLTFREYAVKIIDIVSGESPDESEEVLASTKKEIHILRFCSGHANISIISAVLHHL